MRIQLYMPNASEWQPVVKRIQPHNSFRLLKMQIKSFAARHGLTEEPSQIYDLYLDQKIDIEDDSDLKLAVQNRQT